MTPAHRYHQPATFSSYRYFGDVIVRIIVTTFAILAHSLNVISSSTAIAITKIATTRGDFIFPSTVATTRAIHLHLSAPFANMPSLIALRARRSLRRVTAHYLIVTKPRPLPLAIWLSLFSLVVVVLSLSLVHSLLNRVSHHPLSPFFNTRLAPDGRAVSPSHIANSGQSVRLGNW